MGKRVIIVTKISELLKERGLKQGDLAELTGIRPSTISEIVRDSRSVINKDHLAKIAEVLSIEDISELIEIKYE